MSAIENEIKETQMRQAQRNKETVTVSEILRTDTRDPIDVARAAGDALKRAVA